MKRDAAMRSAADLQDLAPIDRLRAVMTRLRDPDGGCPWDLEQTFQTIAPYTIEEAYEVADAIARGDMGDVKEELGDLLLQVVFHAQMADEKNLFSFDDVAGAIADKLIYRHPHVFGDETAKTADDVLDIWNARKDAEKKNDSAVGGVTLGLPALLRAQKLLKKAARAGFEWPDTDSAWEKVEEELAEFKDAQTPEDREEEFGDLMFCLVNYARMSGMDAEDIMAKANQKFERRFAAMENMLGGSVKDSPLDDMLSVWKKTK